VKICRQHGGGGGGGGGGGESPGLAAAAAAATAAAASRSARTSSSSAAGGTDAFPAAGATSAWLRIGARVWLSGSLTGTYAQYCVCSLDQIHPLPDRCDSAQGAAVGIAYRTAYRALHLRAKVKAGQVVLVHGASGGVGCAAVQLARAHGCRVFGTAGTEEGMRLVCDQGAERVFNHRAAGYMDEVKKAAADNPRARAAGNGGGVDVILEMLANVNLNKDLEVLARGGIIAVIGNRGSIEINPRLLMQRESSIIGVLGGTPEEHAQCHQGISAGMACGAIVPVVSTPAFLLDNAAEAHRVVMDPNQGSAGKVVLITK
jgi:NADPH:quinone reductase